jgi:hypothetical protein
MIEFLIFGFVCIDAENQWFADELEGAALAFAAYVNGVNARFVLACGKRRGIEDETVILVRSASRSFYVRAREICLRSASKMAVNVKLHFDAGLRVGLTDDPTGDVARVRQIERPAKVWREGCHVKPDRKRSDKERFDEGFGNQELCETRSFSGRGQLLHIHTFPQKERGDSFEEAPPRFQQ